MFVNFRKNGGPLEIEFEIPGKVLWSYMYATGHGQPVTGNSQSGQSPTGGKHTLGPAAQFHQDTHMWSVVIINPGNTQQHYSIRLIWHQDGQVMQSWSREGQVLSHEKHGDEADMWGA
jgi:hypothetical protein